MHLADTLICFLLVPIKYIPPCYFCFIFIKATGLLI